MKISTARQRAPLWYEAGIAPHLEGPIGIGKTSLVMSVPKLLEERHGGSYGVVVMNGGNLEVQDATGYLVPIQKDGQSYSQMTRPWWWITAEDKPLEAYDGGIIFVDEQDKAPVDVKKVLGEAKLSGRLCSHQLPGFPGDGKPSTKGWRMWSAGNRSEDRSGSTKNLDHLINRERPFAVAPDLESWTNWATKEGLMPTTIGFANSNPEIVFSGKVPDKQGPFCTPRSLHQLDTYLQLQLGRDGLIPNDPVLMEECHAFIGDGAMVQFINTIKLAQQMPKFEDIIANPAKVKVPEAPDAQILVCFNLAHRVDEKSAGSVVQYVDRFGKEFGVSFARAACNRNPKLVVTPAFNSWAQKNASLMALISKKA